MPESIASSLFASALTDRDVSINSVLVATDLSPASDKAVRYAAAIARRYSSKFYIVHVVSSVGYSFADPDALTIATDLAWRDARTYRARLTLEGTLHDLHAILIVRAGEIWPEVESVIAREGCDLLVTGTHSRQGLNRLIMGSVAEQLFRHASCPVLTVGPNSPEEAERVVSDGARPLLFATDFSEQSLIALPYAASYANRRRTSLVLLHMLSPVPQVEGNRWYTASDVVQLRSQAESDTRRRLLELASTVRLEVEPKAIAQVGTAVEGIVGVARRLNALGIVLGLKPHNSAITHMPWSTAYRVVCEADCPVLTVRA